MNHQLDTILDLLWVYKGADPVDRVRAALAEIEWLKNELVISQRNEYAFKTVLESERRERKQRRPLDELPLMGSERAELYALRSQNRLARECMNANDPLNARTIFGPANQGEGNEQIARQTAGLKGQK